VSGRAGVAAVVAGLLLFAALLAGCGDGTDTGAAGVVGPAEEEPAAPPPEEPVTAAEPADKWEVGAERAVDGYLQALAAGDGEACNWLTIEFMGRIARSNENTYSQNNTKLRRILCESHARDLTGSGDIALSAEFIIGKQASSSEATVDASFTLYDPEVPSYEEGAQPREASGDSSYRLVRKDGRWRINDIVENWFSELGGGELSDPISTDFGGDLVLVRGCETPEKSYCEPLIGD
jgi:hypothetical protein